LQFSTDLAKMHLGQHWLCKLDNSCIRRAPGKKASLSYQQRHPLAGKGEWGDLQVNLVILPEVFTIG
jgi:hypothetical protein